MSDAVEEQWVLYCDKCGMPPEYCEYSPDFESHCCPWLRKKHPELYAQLKVVRGDVDDDDNTAGKKTKEGQQELEKEGPPRPEAPWTTKERLTAFYQKYVPEKVDSVDSLLEKYSGKEDKLFTALVKKYGEEPMDPYYDDEDSEDEEDNHSSGTPQDGDDLEGDMQGMSLKKSNNNTDRKKRRGAGAKKVQKEECHVVVQKIAKNKKRILTNIIGMETIPGVKLKDVSKSFSKKFAGSSSVKDGIKGKEIIIQGDHMYDVAEMIVDKFGAPESCVFLNLDGDIVPLRG